jgi:hypothetical protein
VIPLKYTLFENGIDSLRGAHDSLVRLEDVERGGHHHIKDAIIFLNHAIEILFKYILKNKEEYLIFDNLDKYMKAKELISEQKPNALSVNPELRTVTLLEAHRRLASLCGIPFDKQFAGSIGYINNIRNQIEHYGIELTEQETIALVKNLRSCYELAITFFDQHIGGIADALENARFEYTTSQAFADYADDMYDQWREERI